MTGEGVLGGIVTVSVLSALSLSESFSPDMFAVLIDITVKIEQHPC